MAIVYQGNSTANSSQANHLSPVTKMAFLGYDDILLLDKNDGRVIRIVNNTPLPKALLMLMLLINGNGVFLEWQS